MMPSQNRVVFECDVHYILPNVCSYRELYRER